MFRSASFRHCLAGAAVCSTVFVVLPASALVTRGDVDPSEFTDLAAQEPFNATGGLFINGNLDSSGVLIAPNIVLGAAHTGAASTPAGRTFVIDGQTFEVESIQVVEPSSTDATDGQDAALFTLSAPVTGVAPATLFEGTPQDLVGQEVVFTGVGVSGTSDAPPTTTSTTPSGVLIAGTNVIDAAGFTTTLPSGEEVSFADSILFADFDSPTAAFPNPLGSAAATDLEAQAALSDSGGGVFVFNETTDQFELAALHSFVFPNDSAGTLGFGSITASTGFIPEDLAIIQAAIPEPTSLALLSLGGVALAMRRRRA